MTVKQALKTATVGLPVIERDFSAKFSGEATPEEALRALEGLWFAEQRVLVRVRFKVGDLWNQLNTPGFKKTRKAVLAALRAKLDDAAYQRVLRRYHNYAWVSRKWPEEARHDHKAWTFFVENVPNETEKPAKPEERMLLRITRRYAVDGVEYIECSGRGDREYLAYEKPVEADGQAGE